MGLRQLLCNPTLAGDLCGEASSMPSPSPGGLVTPYQPGALPFVFPRAVEEGSIQDTYIKPDEIVPSPYGWGRSSATGVLGHQSTQSPDVSPTAKAKGTGVRGETSPQVQRWLPASQTQLWDTGLAPRPSSGQHPPSARFGGDHWGALCHRPGVPLFALL